MPTKPDFTAAGVLEKWATPVIGALVLLLVTWTKADIGEMKNDIKEQNAKNVQLQIAVAGLQQRVDNLELSRASRNQQMDNVTQQINALAADVRILTKSQPDK